MPSNRSTEITVWANMKCGTCRQVLAKLKEKGFEPEVIEYLKTPPSAAEIDMACKKLGLEPQAIAREKEDVYNAVASHCKTRQDWLNALHENPILIQRPIVILGRTRDYRAACRKIRHNNLGPP